MDSQKNTDYLLKFDVQVEFLSNNMLSGLGLACIWVDKNKAYFLKTILESLM